MRAAVCWAAVMVCVGCGEAIPGDVAGYEQRCVLLNLEPIPPSDDDPHEGFKNVWACGLTEAAVAARPAGRPWPDGTMIVKESTKASQGYPWLIATMRKTGGTWQWAEFARNFEDDEFLKVPVKEDKCIDCHARVQAVDWVFTAHEARR